MFNISREIATTVRALSDGDLAEATGGFSIRSPRAAWRNWRNRRNNRNQGAADGGSPSDAPPRYSEDVPPPYEAEASPPDYTASPMDPDRPPTPDNPSFGGG